MLARAAAAVRARVVHRAAEPARALAGGAAVARAPARLRARRAASRSPRGRSRQAQRVGARATAAAVLATGSVYLVGDLLGGARRAPRRRIAGARRSRGSGAADERRRPVGAHDDRRRGADRGARDPRVLRRRLRIRPPVSLNSARPMPPLAYFGIESSGLNLVVDLLILFVVVLYLSLIYWTYADARRRIDDPMLSAARRRPRCSRSSARSST